MTKSYTRMLWTAVTLIAVGLLLVGITACDSPVTEERQIAPVATDTLPVQDYSMVSIGNINDKVIARLTGEGITMDGRPLAREALQIADVGDNYDPKRWAQATEWLADKLRGTDIIAADLAQLEVGMPEKLLAHVALENAIALVLVNVSPDVMAQLTNGAGIEATLVVLRRRESGSMVVMTWGQDSEDWTSKDNLERIEQEVREALDAPF